MAASRSFAGVSSGKVKIAEADRDFIWSAGAAGGSSQASSKRSDDGIMSLIAEIDSP